MVLHSLAHNRTQWCYTLGHTIEHKGATLSGAHNLSIFFISYFLIYYLFYIIVTHYFITLLLYTIIRVAVIVCVGGGWGIVKMTMIIRVRLIYRFPKRSLIFHKNITPDSLNKVSLHRHWLNIVCIVSAICDKEMKLYFQVNWTECEVILLPEIASQIVN